MNIGDKVTLPLNCGMVEKYIVDGTPLSSKVRHGQTTTMNGINRGEIVDVSEHYCLVQYTDTKGNDVRLIWTKDRLTVVEFSDGSKANINDWILATSILDFADGVPFKATVGEKQLEGKMRREKNRWYLCQDQISGSSCDNKLGYKHSYILGQDDELATNFASGLLSIRSLYVKQLNSIQNDQSSKTSNNGKAIIVQRVTPLVSVAERRNGVAVTGRRSRTTTQVGHLSYQKINSYS